MELLAQSIPENKKTINSKTVQDLLILLESYLDDKGLDFLKNKSSKDFKIFKTNKNYQMDLDHFNTVFNKIEKLINEPDLGTELAIKHSWFKKSLIKPNFKTNYALNKDNAHMFKGFFPTVAASLIEHYIEISNELFDIQFFVNKKSCKFIMTPSKNGINHQLIEAIMYGMHRYFCVLSQERLIHLQMPHYNTQRKPDLYQNSYGVIPSFTEEKKYELEYTLRGSLESFNKIHVGTLFWLEKLYEKELPNTSFSNRNRAMIRILLPFGMANREKISSIYNLSVSSLQRKLKHEGNTFSNLVLEERMNLAENYLKNSDLNISEVSNLLGYQEISHFSKAFKRWFGVAPSIYIN